MKLTISVFCLLVIWGQVEISLADEIINRGEPAAGPAVYSGSLLAGGAFSVQCGDNTFYFTGHYSAPGGKLHPFGIASPGGGEWTVICSGNQITGHCPEYTVVRTVNFTSRRVEISDTITNHRAEPLGLWVRNEVDLSALGNPSIRLAGNPDPAVTEYHSIGNPSVYVSIPQGGLGFIAEDDVFRNQAKLFVHRNDATIFAGIETRVLRLAVGETYTLEWAVYPVAGPDYYDFVNLVRQDWGANYPVLGPWRWGFQTIQDMSVEEIRAFVKHQGIRYFIAHDWVEWEPNPQWGTQRIAFGTDVMSSYWAQRRAYYLENVRKIHEACPDVKVFAYYNSMRESADDTLQRFADGLYNDIAGQYVTKVFSPTTNLNYIMIPTLNNSFGQAMLNVAQQYFDELEVDGIYWDEMEGIQFGKLLFTYNNFDGHSCLLDPQNYTILREAGVGPLASRLFYNEVTRVIQQINGGILLGNGPTGSKDTLRDRVQRMVEVQHNDYFAFEGNLQTPLGYLSTQTSWDDFLRTFGMAMLPGVCIGADLPHDISPHLFPFTPIELHAGYLLGQERIISTHTGNYGWVNDYSLVRVRHFNTTGQLTQVDFSTTLNSEARTAVTLNEKEAIVLERLPVTFEPTEGTSIAQQVRYDEKGLSMYLTAPQGGTLKIGNGDFVLQNDMIVNVRLGSESRTVVVVDHTLNIAVPAAFDDNIFVYTAPAAMINNASFESPVLADGNWPPVPPDGWMVEGSTGYTVGLWNPPSGRFTGCEGSGTPVGGDGANILYLCPKSGSGNNAIVKQTLAFPFQAGTYTLTAAVGTANGFTAAENNRLVMMQGSTQLSWTSIPQAQIPVGSFVDKSVTFVVPENSSYIGLPITIMLFSSVTSSSARMTCFDHVRLEFTPEEEDFGTVIFESEFVGVTGEDIASLPEWSTGATYSAATRTIEGNTGKFHGDGGGAWYNSSIRADKSSGGARNFNPISEVGNRFEHTVVAVDSTDPFYGSLHRSWVGPQPDATASAFNLIGERLCCDMVWNPATNAVTIYLRVINSTTTAVNTGIVAQTLTTTADLDDGDQIRLALQVRDSGSGKDVRIAYRAPRPWSEWISSAWVNPTSSSYGTNAFASDWKNRWSNNTYFYIETSCRDDGYIRYPSTTWIDDVVVMGDAEVVNIPGDANGDGKVDVGDLGILAANYGGTDKRWSQGDFNGDDKVDVGDLGILAANYGRGTSGADFNTDYANVFGTTADDASEDAENIDSSLCSSLGPPLIAGLLLATLILAKLKE
jgi:hypothetical protein